MKRFWATLLALILLAGILPANHAEAASTTATVKGGWLRLRAEASFDAETVASYYTGTRMTVLGTKGAWYHVSAPDGYTGYMYGAYLTVGTSSGNGGSENTPATVVSANGLDVRLRSGPSTAYGVIGLYSVGTKATILSSGTYWHYVSIGGQKGYMMSQFLSVSGTSVAPPSGGSYTAYVTSRNGLGVRLRSGAGTGYGVLGLYSVGTQVTVLEHGRTWDYIRVGSRTGYMMNEFLTVNKPAEPVPPMEPGSYTAYVVSSNGLPVKLRSGAGTGYGVIAKFAVGTEVTVLEHNKTWDFVRIKTASGSVTGYMMNQFLSAKQTGTTVEGVMLSAAEAAPGQTLSATVTPSNAKVNYEWADDRGALLSTSATYTVREADVGRRIRVRVTGRDGYTGSAVSAYATVSKSSVGSVVLEAVFLSQTQPKVGDTITAKTDPFVDPASGGVAYTWTRDDGTVVGKEQAYTVQYSDAGHSLSCTVSGVASQNVSGKVVSAWTSPVQADQPDQPDVISGKVSLPAAILPGVELNPVVAVNCKDIVYQWYADGVLVSSSASLKVTPDMAGRTIKLIVQPRVNSGWTGQVESNGCNVISDTAATGTNL